MIQANELRIGNLVSFYGENVKVTSIDSESIGINIITIDYPLIMEIEPIPLTEEWLLKFGWKDEFAKGMLIRYGLKIRLLGHDMNIKHVHQLQNLYFALTQTELELKQI